jgi:hypothetical protein
MTGLKTKTLRILLVALVLITKSGPPAAAQSSEHGGKALTWREAHKQDIEVLRETNRISGAYELAHNRYATARLESYFHGRTSWGNFFGVEALFPALRSDRMYLVVYNLRWPTETSKETNVVL